MSRPFCHLSGDSGSQPDWQFDRPTCLDKFGQFDLTRRISISRSDRKDRRVTDLAPFRRWSRSVLNAWGARTGQRGSGRYVHRIPCARLPAHSSFLQSARWPDSWEFGLRTINANSRESNYESTKRWGGCCVATAGHELGLFVRMKIHCMVVSGYV